MTGTSVGSGTDFDYLTIKYVQYFIPPQPTCPYLFVWDGSSFVEDNTILTASEDAPQGKVVTDFYKIQKPLVAKENKYHLQIRELEEEKSFIDYIELIAIDYPATSKIAVAPDGKIFGIEESIGPIAAVDDKGTDQLDKVKEADGDFYVCTERGSLTLTFSLPKKYHGDIAGGGIGSDIRGDRRCYDYMAKVLDSSPGDEKILNEIRIEVQDKNGTWIELPDAPPRTTLTENFWLLDTPDLELGEEFKVRLSWDREYSTDELRYFFASKIKPEKKSIALVSANHSKNCAVNKLLNNADHQFVTLDVGETLDLYFSAEEPLPDGMVRDFVLKSVGYYIPNYKEQLTISSNEFVLFNNFPNPANPITEIAYILPQDCNVKLTIYNVLGQKIKTLLDGFQKAGYRTVRWDARNDKGEEVASGVYSYRLKTEKFSETKKMLLLR